MYTAFFDLDNTILNTSSGRIMFKGSREHGIIGRKEIRKAILITVLYRLGLVSADKAVARWLGWYAGLSVDELAPIALEWAEELKRVIRDDARREIDFHRVRGARTVILSASPTFVCERMKSELGMDEILCTELEVVDGRLTGVLKGRYCHGREKLSRALDYCRRGGQRIEEAYYYADSIADLPVLESVGFPVCVTPDRKLTRVARKRGWRINMWE